MSHHHDHENDINDLGLQADLAMWHKKPVERRDILKMGAMGVGALLASSSFAQQACIGVIPEETAGPYPANGSAGMGGGPGGPPNGMPPGPPPNGAHGGPPPGMPPQGGPGGPRVIPPDAAPPLAGMPSDNALNVLTRSGIVRRDITTSLVTGNRAEGVPTTMNLQLVNVNNACAPLAGYAIYAWHCDAQGDYSMYSANVLEEDYLRGVQATDAEGMVRFETIFPACYPGRWPHVHFEIYPSLAAATGAANTLHTSQLAIPQNVCEVVYNNVAAYSSSVANLAQLSLQTDNVFSDGYDLQLASVTGSLSSGYNLTLQVGISV